MRKKKITNFRTSDLSTPPLKIILAAETGHKLSEMPSGKCNGKKTYYHLGGVLDCEEYLVFTRDDVVSQRLKFGSAFLSSSWESKIALLFGSGPNRVMETACFDANVQ